MNQIQKNKNQIQEQTQTGIMTSCLSFMSFEQTNVEICNTLCFEQNVQEVVI